MRVSLHYNEGDELSIQLCTDQWAKRVQQVHKTGRSCLVMKFSQKIPRGAHQERPQLVHQQGKMC